MSSANSNFLEIVVGISWMYRLESNGPLLRFFHLTYLTHRLIFFETCLYMCSLVQCLICAWAPALSPACSIGMYSFIAGFILLKIIRFLADFPGLRTATTFVSLNAFGRKPELHVLRKNTASNHQYQDQSALKIQDIKHPFRQLYQFWYYKSQKWNLKFFTYINTLSPRNSFFIAIVYFFPDGACDIFCIWLAITFSLIGNCPAFDDLPQSRFLFFKRSKYIYDYSM